MDERVARRYARALFMAAQDQKAIDPIGQELAQIDDMIRTQDQLRYYIFSPLVARNRKIEAIEKAFSGYNTLLRRLLDLLVEKGREENLPLVRRVYEQLREENAGILRAAIQSARPLTTEQRTALIARLEQQSGKKVIATDEVIPDLLGGVRVQIGDTMLDGSVRGDLRRLKERFIHELARQN